MILCIWIGTYFQEEFNKVEVGDVARVACLLQWRFALWDRYSVDVGMTKQGPGQVLPNGLPRACCEQRKIERLKYEQKGLQQTLTRIVGKENVIDGRIKSLASRNYLTGARSQLGGSGTGKDLCIVTPRRLHQVIDCVEAIVDADCAVLPQGQNTGFFDGRIRPSWLEFGKINLCC
jgi:hypothetical protein